jgi:hypothetical protein
MPWHFVGRTEQIERIRATVQAPDSGPLVITGESGMGRSTVLRQALDQLDDSDRMVIHLTPDGGYVPFATVSAHLPEDFPTTAPLGVAVRVAVDAILDRAAGRRVVVVVDDAHLADHASMLVLRDLHRRAGALPLITRPSTSGAARVPDPLDCLRYERGIQTLCLPPLSADEVGVVLSSVLGGRVRRATSEALHAVTRGNPRLLHDLVGDDRLSEHTVQEDGLWRFDARRTTVGTVLDPEGVTKLVDATRKAWRDLSLDRAEELCCLAKWCGAVERVADVQAGVLLLRGRAREALRFLDSLQLRHAGGTSWSRTAPMRALVLALGLGRTDEAGELLRLAAGTTPEDRSHLLALRAWLLAVTGAPRAATEALDVLDRGGNRDAALFTRAARAAVELASGSPATAVPHLRRALIAAQSRRDDAPWMAPYLTANLIDALLLAGRLTEATAVASDFHGGRRDNGWNVVATLADFIQHRTPTDVAALPVAS